MRQRWLHADETQIRFAAHRRDQRRYGDYWNRLLSDVAEAGELAEGVDLFAVRMLAFGAMNWTAEWFGRQRSVDATTVADSACRMLLGGLARDASRVLGQPSA